MTEAEEQRAADVEAEIDGASHCDVTETEFWMLRAMAARADSDRLVAITVAELARVLNLRCLKHVRHVRDRLIAKGYVVTVCRRWRLPNVYRLTFARPSEDLRRRHRAAIELARSAAPVSLPLPLFEDVAMTSVLYGAAVTLNRDTQTALVSPAGRCR